MTRLDQALTGARPSSLGELEQLVTGVGRSPWLWGQAVRFDRRRRSHRVLCKTEHLEIALFCWAQGQDTTFHDHGGASGAVFVCGGILLEDAVRAADGRVIRKDEHVRRAGSAFSFGPDYIHRVRHDSTQGIALSIHAYTPMRSKPTDYELLPGGALRAVDPDRELQPA